MSINLLGMFIANFIKNLRNMAVIGEFIKKAIDVTGYIKGDGNPIEEQEKVLKDLLETAKLTAFGKKYGFVCKYPR